MTHMNSNNKNTLLKIDSVMFYVSDLGCPDAKLIARATHIEKIEFLKK